MQPNPKRWNITLRVINIEIAEFDQIKLSQASMDKLMHANWNYFNWQFIYEKKREFSHQLAINSQETLTSLNIGDAFAANYRCILKDSISLENVCIVGIFWSTNRFYSWESNFVDETLITSFSGTNDVGLSLSFFG